jgi:hypothetical protein
MGRPVPPSYLVLVALDAFVVASAFTLVKGDRIQDEPFVPLPAEQQWLRCVRKKREENQKNRKQEEKDAKKNLLLPKAFVRHPTR